MGPLSALAAATLVCVPSRHEFPEGFPQTLTEALAARTPVVASDHPVFTRVLRDGEGVRYFPAGNAGTITTNVSNSCLKAVGNRNQSSRTKLRPTVPPRPR